MTKTPGSFLGEKSQNVDKVSVVDSKSIRKYQKSRMFMPTDKIVSVQKIWAETPGSFPDEKPKYVPRVNAADFKLNKKYNKVFKQPFEIQTEPTRLQEKYVSLKHQELEKEHHDDAKDDGDSKLLLKSTLCDVFSKTFKPLQTSTF